MLLLLYYSPPKQNSVTLIPCKSLTCTFTSNREIAQALAQQGHPRLHCKASPAQLKCALLTPQYFMAPSMFTSWIHSDKSTSYLEPRQFLNSALELTKKLRGTHVIMRGRPFTFLLQYKVSLKPSFFTRNNCNTFSSKKIKKYKN